MSHRRACTMLLGIGMYYASVSPLGVQASLSAQIHHHERVLHETRLELQQKRKALHGVQTQLSDLQQQLARTRTAITQADSRLAVIDADVRASRRRIAWNRTQLAAAHATLIRHSHALERRLRGIYEFGDVNYFNVLLSATSYTDFTERWEDLRFLILENNKTIRLRKADEARIARAERELEGMEAQLSASLQDAEQTRSRLAALREERTNLVALADQRRMAVERKIQDLDELSASEERSLEGEIAEQQRQLEAQRRVASATHSGGGPATGSGRFSWPLRGEITSPFGWRSNPMGSGGDFHPGLDIAAPTGTPIAAADAGRVIIAGWVSGYGNYIAIDHGGGVSTAYGHCSQILVSIGQDVSRGQVIGLVGSTGHSTGPHVHFEVRIHGAPVDPASRLP